MLMTHHVFTRRGSSSSVSLKICRRGLKVRCSLAGLSHFLGESEIFSPHSVSNTKFSPSTCMGLNSSNSDSIK